MTTHPATWQTRFGLTTCPAQALDASMSPTLQGVAVIYTQTEAGESILLVLESRTRSLRQQCEKRLQTGKLPPIEQLLISYKAETPTLGSPEAIHAGCREQVIFAGELRRELRPTMR